MLIKGKKEFNKGVILAISFMIVLAIMFSPLFGEKRNAFRASDRFFNSIAKGSTYYIDKLLKENEEYKGKSIDLVLTLGDEDLTKKARDLFYATGAAVSGENGRLSVKGDLGQILETAVRDSDAMFYNKGEEVARKYGFPEKEVLFVWHKAFSAMNKSLSKQERFEDAAFVEEVMKRGVEVGYNFYKIDPISAKSRAGMLSFSLIFYVIYTMWWGYAILFMFEGMGLQMKAGAKKET